jgi:hypothetical protein
MRADQPARAIAGVISAIRILTVAALVVAVLVLLIGGH